MIKYWAIWGVLIFVILGLLVMVYLRGMKINELVSERNALKGNISFLEGEIEIRNKKAVEADKRNRELEKAAVKAKDKGGFDWNSILPDDDVVIRLRKD